MSEKIEEIKPIEPEEIKKGEKISLEAGDDLLFIVLPEDKSPREVVEFAKYLEAAKRNGATVFITRDNIKLYRVRK